MDQMRLFCHLVASRITSEPISDDARDMLNAETITALYPLAKRQDLAHLVCQAIEEAHILPAEHSLLVPYKRELHMAILRCHLIEYEKEQLIDALSQAGIDHIPLKGAVLRPLYPEPWMRTSCDLDILVRESTIEQAAELIQALGYTDLKRNFHDYSLTAPSGVHLELHYRILENDPSTDPLLEQVWEHAHPIAQGSYTYEMDTEFFYFHILAHAAHHFATGGCGIRPLIDLHLLHQKMPCNKEALDQLLIQSHLDRFYRSATALAEQILAGGPGDAHSEAMLSYLLRGTIYGLMEHQVAIREHQHPTTASYLSSRLFLSADTLKYRYPILKKHPWLLPFCNLSRWIELLFNGRLSHSIKEWRLMRMNQRRADNPVAELIHALDLDHEG